MRVCRKFKAEIDCGSSIRRGPISPPSLRWIQTLLLASSCLLWRSNAFQTLWLRRGAIERSSYGSLINIWIRVSAEKSDQVKFEQRLDTAYRIRNSFVHSGQSMPNAVAIADRRNVPSAIYDDRGTRRRAPGLIWLQKIVRATLLGFLSTVTQEHPSKPRKPVFRSLAKRANIIRLVAAGPIQKGEPITWDKLMLD